VTDWDSNPLDFRDHEKYRNDLQAEVERLSRLAENPDFKWFIEQLAGQRDMYKAQMTNAADRDFHVGLFTAMDLATSWPAVRLKNDLQALKDSGNQER
jgi:hypothetical protein